MWKVEVSDYYTTYREYFNSKKDALDYCEMIKCITSKASISIEDMTPVDGNEYTDGEVVWIQKVN